MNPASERRLASTALASGVRVALLLIALACGKALSPSSSSSSHWLACERDVECTGLADATQCGEAGFCVDEAGGRVRQPVEPLSGPECPAPQAGDNVSCDGEPVWSRDPASGLCCEYRNSCSAPSGWPGFNNELECETSCRCETVDYGDPPGTFGVERISLECACRDGDCARTLQEQLARVCNDPRGQAWVRAEGCGMIAIANEGTFAGRDFVYDAATGALIGTSSYSDEPSIRPCVIASSVAGLGFDCDAATRCELCGNDFFPLVPNCE
jgi:hypothetical protein